MKLIDKLPFFYEECPVTNTIQSGLNSEKDNLINKTNSTVDQLYINSATWGLELWEKFVGINKSSGSLTDRRLRVITKLTAKRTTTKKVFEELCKVYVDDVKINEIFEEYKILISLTEKLESDLPKEYNLTEINNGIWEIKPAHLEHELNLIHSKKLNIVTNYSDVKYKYIPCNSIYAGQYQANTYIKDSELSVLPPSNNENEHTALLGFAIVGKAILGIYLPPYVYEDMDASLLGVAVLGDAILGTY